MTEIAEKYNGVFFSRCEYLQTEEETDDISTVFYPDEPELVVAYPAEDLVKIYIEQFKLGYLVTGIKLCEEGTLLLNLNKMEEE